MTSYPFLFVRVISEAFLLKFRITKVLTDMILFIEFISREVFKVIKLVVDRSCSNFVGFQIFNHFSSYHCTFHKVDLIHFNWFEVFYVTSLYYSFSHLFLNQSTLTQDLLFFTLSLILAFLFFFVFSPHYPFQVHQSKSF